MPWNGLMQRLGIAVNQQEPSLRNPLSVLGPAAPAGGGVAGTGDPGTGDSAAPKTGPKTGPTSGDRNAWQYLIASSTVAGGRPSWALMGPSTGVEVANDATPEQVASTLAEQGWRMVTVCPPVRSEHGTINYIFCRPIP